jgi:hypothetical protein
LKSAAATVRVIVALDCYASSLGERLLQQTLREAV